MAKRRAAPAAADPFDTRERLLQAIREVAGAEQFRVFANASDPHHVGEYVVAVDRDGLTIREAWDADDPGHHITWWELHHIAGQATEHMQDIQRDTQAIMDELETWEAIRDGEAHRILRARQIQRTQTMRRLCDEATKVLGVWERPRVAPRSSSAWRDLVRQRNGRPRR